MVYLLSGYISMLSANACMKAKVERMVGIKSDNLVSLVRVLHFLIRSRTEINR
jgi:hypothetical protein